MPANEIVCKLNSYLGLTGIKRANSFHCNKNLVDPTRSPKGFIQFNWLER